MKDVFKKSVYNTGYLGLGEYSSKDKAYVSWKNMLFRCYSKNRLDKFPSYINCIMCNEWHNFQNFAKWFNDNYIEYYHIDKDLLFKKNNIYSPETCIFLPQEINKLLTKTDSKRGNCPIGVFYNKKTSNFKAQICIGFKSRIGLGTFKTKEDAFVCYKNVKENYIKKTAIDYYSTGKISLKAYNALYNYIVEITD